MEYRYRIGRRWYRGHTLRLTEISPVKAARIALRYQLGDRLKVAYDPNNFTRSTLEVGPTAVGIAYVCLVAAGTLLSATWIGVILYAAIRA